MEKSKDLIDFEKEYYSEIKNFNVSEADLTELKIPKKVLAYEVFLRKNLGDSLAKFGEDDDYDANSKRKVEKVPIDKLDNSELANIISEIDTSEFDNNLDAYINSKKEND